MPGPNLKEASINLYWPKRTAFFLKEIVMNSEISNIPVTANVIFKEIHDIESAQKAIVAGGVVSVARIFPTVAGMEAILAGNKISDKDEEKFLAENYEKLEPHEQVLHRCFSIVFETSAQRDAFVAVKSNKDVFQSVEASVELNALGITFAPPATGNVTFPDPLQQWPLGNTQVPRIWDCADGCGQVVAVLDTGIDIRHPDLEHQLWEVRSPGVVNGLNFIAGPFFDVQDLNGHGTHVSGTVAARRGNGLGVTGIAPDAKIMTMRVLNANGSGTVTAVALGILWAGFLGADVINLSLGFQVPYIAVIAAAIANTVARPQRPVIVAAAGDANSNSAGFYPASDPNVICVAAINSLNTKAIFSNWGNVVDVSAPGEAIMSTTLGGGFAVMNGTSMAAPHVSAMVAIIRQRLPNLLQSEYLEIVQAYTHSVTSSVPIGAGAIDFTDLNELLCGCGCSPCGWREILEERLLNRERLAKFNTINGTGNPVNPGVLACIPITVPALHPSFYLHWGDAANDILETDDDEIIYIRVCNPYCNVTFRNLKIRRIKISPNPSLPNGDPSVELAASSLICYGDLGPSSCHTREYAFITRGALPGPCVLEVEYCIESIELSGESNRGQTNFTLPLIMS